MVCKQTRGQIRSQTDWGTDDWSASRVRGRWNYSGGIHFSGLISCQNFYKLPPTTLSENTWNKEEKKRNWGESSWIMRRQGDTFFFFSNQLDDCRGSLQQRLWRMSLLRMPGTTGNTLQSRDLKRCCARIGLFSSHIYNTGKKNIDSCAFVVITKN